MRGRVTFLCFAVLLLVSACGEQQPKLTVLAAASLTDVFDSLRGPFATRQESVSVTFSFAGSSQLVAQVEQGVRADVIATADEDTMSRLSSAGLLEGPPRTFALNTLAIVVARGNPKDVVGLRDLARDDLTVALAAEEVPAGRYAREALTAAGITARPVSLEEDVRAIVSKVSLGEVDAGIVYATDVQAGGSGVDAVKIPESGNVVARYPIAVLKDAPNATAAHAFVDMILSDEGKRALLQAGFRTP